MLYYSLSLLFPISIVLCYYCLIVYCLVSHNRKYQTTYAIVSSLIVSALYYHVYYTALNWSSIISSTFLYTTL